MAESLGLSEPRAPPWKPRVTLTAPGSGRGLARRSRARRRPAPALASRPARLGVRREQLSPQTSPDAAIVKSAGCQRARTPGARATPPPLLACARPPPQVEGRPGHPTPVSPTAAGPAPQQWSILPALPPGCRLLTSGDLRLICACQALRPCPARPVEPTPWFWAAHKSKALNKCMHFCRTWSKVLGTS